MKEKIVVTASSALLIVLGVVLDFAPQETAAALGIAVVPATTALTQVLASALLGMGFVNWFSRANRMGGIYGRRSRWETSCSSEPARFHWSAPTPVIPMPKSSALLPWSSRCLPSPSAG